MRSTFLVPLFLLPSALLTGALALAGCGGGSSSTTTPLTSAPLGAYSAKDIQVRVTATGASVTLQCGQSAQITQPITLDASGHFDVAGTIIPFTATPFPPKPVPARFTGTTDGKTMTITVTPAPYRFQPQSNAYALTYGTSPALEFGGCPG